MTSSTAANRVFVDTSGFFALLSRTDEFHRRAEALVASKRFVFTTSDAVVSETCTLLKMRRVARLCSSLFGLLTESHALNLQFVTPERFWKTKEFFVKRIDQGYSFVDCSSFIVMQELKLSQALTSDMHFRKAGFLPLLRS